LRLISSGSVQPVNVDLIPSFATVDERLQDAPWHTVDTDADGTAEHYGTPYQWGSDVLMYNTDVFAEPPDSWSVVFEETELADGQANTGRIEAYDGPIALASVALYVKATQPELGIDDPYALTREQFDAVLDVARAQRELVARYWHDAFIQISDFVNEGIVASTSWPFQRNLLQFDGHPIASVIPQEGATGWADTTMMAADAPHPNCAYAWLEWSLNPKLQGDLAAWFGSVPAVLAGCEGNELLGEGGCDTNGLGDFDQIFFWKTPQADCFEPGSGRECVPYHEWVTSYVAVIGGR
jgi:putative spermidine/putrescine transport system substrate-binding protein